jgi:uncharacterized protein YqgV (UPF0045/DUF77 family)
MTDMNMDLQIKSVEAQVLATHNDLKAWIEKANEEVKAAGTASAETKSAIDKVAEKANDVADRLASLEQKQASHFEGAAPQQSPGDMLVNSDEFKHMQSKRHGSARIEIKTAIVNAVPSMTQPLVAGHRLDGIVTAPNRPLRLRDVLPQSRTTSNIVWFAKENFLSMQLLAA